MAWSQSQDQPQNATGTVEDENDWMSYLLEAPLFARVPPGNIQQLFVRFMPHKVKANEWVVREGEPGDFFYVLETGRAQVKDKSDRILAELGPGEYFGEESLVCDTTRISCVLWISYGTLVILDDTALYVLLAET